VIDLSIWYRGAASDCCTCDDEPIKYDLKYTSNCKVVFFILPNHGVRSPHFAYRVLLLLLTNAVRHHRPSISGASDLPPEPIRACAALFEQNQI
jgi:hypothetical protein